MIDLRVREDGRVERVETVVFKACNVLKVQEGSLTYAPQFGIDVRDFLNPDIEIQMETFKAYTIKKMTEIGINPVELLTNEQVLNTILNYKVVETDTAGRGLIV